MKQDVPPTPDAIPRKRSQLRKVPDLWLAEWLARDNLAASDRRRLEETRGQRRRPVSARVVGFVGTEAGMSKPQRQAVRRALAGATAAHHAGTTAADAQFHRLCHTLGVPVVLHPPQGRGAVRTDMHDVTHAEAASPSYDRDIVRASDVVVAAPKEGREPPLAIPGTWTVVRYARERRTPVRVFMPDGQEANGNGN